MSAPTGPWRIESVCETRRRRNRGESMVERSRCLGSVESVVAFSCGIVTSQEDRGRREDRKQAGTLPSF